MDISVIVPVYNVEKYLPKCIDSILAQTFTNFELLLINDGSKDSSGTICDEYAAKDSRIRVFHKENGGVSAARNLGLDNAKGEWIAFVDSDDYIDNDFLKVLIENKKEQGVVICGYTLRDYNDNIKRTKQFENCTICKHDITNDIESFDNILCYGTICGKLYSNQIISRHKLRFDTAIRYHEDHLFYFEYIINIEHLIVVDYTGYNYITRGINTSLSSQATYDDSMIYLSYQLLISEIDLLKNAWSIASPLPQITSFLCGILLHATKMSFLNRRSVEQCQEYISLCKDADLGHKFIAKSSFSKIQKFIIKHFQVRYSYAMLQLLMLLRKN